VIRIEVDVQVEYGNAEGKVTIYQRASEYTGEWQCGILDLDEARQLHEALDRIKALWVPVDRD
jgi:hypothetical protein